MIQKILIGIVVSLVLVVATLGFLYKRSAGAEAAAKAERDGYIELIRVKDNALRSLERTLEAAYLEREKARKDADAWKRKWREVKVNDPICKAWAESKLPDCVVNQLRRSTEGSSSDDNRTTHGAIVSNP